MDAVPAHDGGGRDGDAGDPGDAVDSSAGDRTAVDVDAPADGAADVASDQAARDMPEAAVVDSQPAPADGADGNGSSGGSGPTGGGGAIASGGVTGTGGTIDTGSGGVSGSGGGGGGAIASGGVTGSGGAIGSGGVSGSGGTIGSGGGSGVGVGSGGAGGGMQTGAGVLAGRITTKADPRALFATPVPGALVTIEGPERRQAISDANGSYHFDRLSPGIYAVHAWQPGFGAEAAAERELTPSPGDRDRTVPATGPGILQHFTCASPCQPAAAPPVVRAIDPARELVILDKMVILDPRADNATGGPWSFRYLIEQMAWDTTGNVLVESWLTSMAGSGRDVTSLRSYWPTVVENGQVVPDLARAPFRLLAIVNRLDLHAAGNGEARFIYGIYPVPGAPSFNLQSAAFTVSIDFYLPSTADLPDRKAWARRFHELGDIALDSSGRYATALQALTDVIVRARRTVFDASNPSGSNLAALRVNERFRTDAPFELRQFRLQPDPASGHIALRVAPLPQTPDWALSGQDGPLPSFVNQQAALMQTGFAFLPDALLALVAPATSPAKRWSFPSIFTEPLRQSFAGQTCMGCHWSESPSPPASTFHVDPVAGGASGFVTQIDVPRRTAFLYHQLTCPAGGCASGAVEMMPPTQ